MPTSHELRLACVQKCLVRWETNFGIPFEGAVTFSSFLRARSLAQKFVRVSASFDTFICPFPREALGLDQLQRPLDDRIWQWKLALGISPS